MCLLSVVVVTYKKVRPNTNSEKGPSKSVGEGPDTEKEVDLDSGQFGITDPEDEGKACHQSGGSPLSGYLLTLSSCWIPGTLLPNRTTHPVDSYKRKHQH